jgi:hypothetical protein
VRHVPSDLCIKPLAAYTDAFNVTIFGGAVPDVPYMMYPEGVAMRQAWDRYAESIQGMQGAPAPGDYNLTADGWAFRVRRGVHC